MRTLVSASHGAIYAMQSKENGHICMKFMKNHREVVLPVNMTKGAVEIERIQAMRDDGDVYFMVIYKKIRDYEIDVEYDHL